MIDGLRIDLTTEELVRHLDERIRYHHERAADCESKAKRVEALESPRGSGDPGDPGDDEDAQLLAVWPSYIHQLEHRAARHRSRETLLVFLRNHVTANEIYRLTEVDLRSAELLPVEEGMQIL